MVSRTTQRHRNLCHWHGDIIVEDSHMEISPAHSRVKLILTRVKTGLLWSVREHPGLPMTGLPGYDAEISMQILYTVPLMDCIWRLCSATDLKIQRVTRPNLE